jgi:choline transport protein
VALYSTYIVPIALLVVRRLSGDEIPFGPWHLGRWGMPLNIFSLVYALFVSIWMFFPAFVPVTAVNMNYTSVVYGGTFIFSAVAWYTYGKTTYLGPIKEVRE